MKSKEECNSFIYSIIPVILTKAFYYTVYDEDSNSYKKGRLCSEPYQTLSINSLIPKLFDQKFDNDDIVNTFLSERAIEYYVFTSLINKYKDEYISYYNSNKDTEIDSIYSFCKNIYPFIENHEPCSFYLDEKGKIVNADRIKCLRKLYKETLSSTDTQQHA